MSLVSNETLQYANSSAKVPFQAIAGEERKLTFMLLYKSLQISILMLYPFVLDPRHAYFW